MFPTFPQGGNPVFPVEVELNDGSITTVDITPSFDVLDVEQALAIAAVLGEEGYKELLEGTVTETSYRALIWVQLQKAGLPVMWEDMLAVAV